MPSLKGFLLRDSIRPHPFQLTQARARRHRHNHLGLVRMALLPDPPRSPDAPPLEGDGTRPSALTIQIVSTVNKLSDEPWLPVQGIVTLFRIQVKADDQTWEVQRRYSDFNELNQRLAKAFGEAALPELPPKLLLNSDDDIAERYLELDAYLRKLLQITNIARNYRLLEFLGIAKQGVRYGVRNYECALLRTDAFPAPGSPSWCCASPVCVHAAGTTRRKVRATATFETTTCSGAKLKRSSRCLEGGPSSFRHAPADSSALSTPGRAGALLSTQPLHWVTINRSRFSCRSGSADDTWSCWAAHRPQSQNTDHTDTHMLQTAVWVIGHGDVKYVVSWLLLCTASDGPPNRPTPRWLVSLSYGRSVVLARDWRRDRVWCAVYLYM